MPELHLDGTDLVHISMALEDRILYLQRRGDWHGAEHLRSLQEYWDLFLVENDTPDEARLVVGNDN